MTWIRDRLGPDRLSERRGLPSVGTAAIHAAQSPRGPIRPHSALAYRPPAPEAFLSGGMLEIHLRGMDHL